MLTREFEEFLTGLNLPAGDRFVIERYVSSVYAGKKMDADVAWGRLLANLKEEIAGRKVIYRRITSPAVRNAMDEYIALLEELHVRILQAKKERSFGGAEPVLSKQEETWQEWATQQERLNACADMDMAYATDSPKTRRRIKPFASQTWMQERKRYVQARLLSIKREQRVHSVGVSASGQLVADTLHGAAILMLTSKAKNRILTKHNAMLQDVNPYDARARWKTWESALEKPAKGEKSKDADKTYEIDLLQYARTGVPIAELLLTKYPQYRAYYAPDAAQPVRRYTDLEKAEDVAALTTQQDDMENEEELQQVQPTQQAAAKPLPTSLKQALDTWDEEGGVDWKNASL